MKIRLAKFEEIKTENIFGIISTTGNFFFQITCFFSSVRDYSIIPRKLEIRNDNKIDIFLTAAK